jgi:replicative superfamily II helicase
VVDFKSLKKSSSAGLETDPRKIFQHLIKPDGVNELYASQAEVLDAWHSRRSESDLIIKLPTGGGKSITGLLIAQSTLNELKQPVLYLTPTRQLNAQICDEGARFGIRAAPYTSAKDGLPTAFLNCEAVGVATYDAVFNGISKFGTIDKLGEVGQLGALILDDAHAAFDTVWDSFTFEIELAKHKELYNEIASIFRADFRQLNRGNSFDDVVSGREYLVLDVPYWAWLSKLDQVAAVINAYGPHKVNLWSWPHIRDELHVCQALISKKSISILPMLPLVDRSRAYGHARRRVYMSATIADDSEVVRTFGVSGKRLAKPITAASLAGVGERMILAPALIPSSAGKAHESLTHNLIQSVKAASKNTAILVPSFQAGTGWEGIAAVPKTGDETVSLIERLKKEPGTAAVLPRRYDGVDLPGEACRLLVMDGLPYGASNYDAWRINTLSYGSAGLTLAQRLEQAIGRGSRGTADYCVVVFTGSDLIAWVGVKDNLKYMSAATRKQLELGLNISRAVESAGEFAETAWKCLNRDPDWRAYHADELGDAAVAPPQDEEKLQTFEHERNGIAELRIRQFSKAISEFEEGIDSTKDAALKGWFHQLKARALYQANDLHRWEESQAKAYHLNRQLTAPLGQVAVELREAPADQAMAVAVKVEGFVHPGVAVSSFDDAASYLTSYTTANQFEGALQKFFQWIGLEASRPDYDYKEGPDVLAFGAKGPVLVIEAKSRRKEGNRLTKTMHNQVLAHENWYRANYGSEREVTRVVVYPNEAAEANAGAIGTSALTFVKLEQLLHDGRELLKRVAVAPEDKRIETAQAAIADLKLDPASIVARLCEFSN